MSKTVTTVASTDNPVTRAEALTFLRQNAGVDDDLVDSLIDMAVEQVELITEHKLQDATYIEYFDSFPKYSNGGLVTDRLICLKWAPLVSVTSVKYLDQDGTEQTIASSNYTVSNKSAVNSSIVFNNSYSIPLTDDVIDSVYVEYVAGYESWQSGVPGVPKSLITAIKYFVAEIYEHRLFNEEGAIVGTLQPNSIAMQLLGSYRRNTPTAIGKSSTSSRTVN